jgi:hypothetical protein
MYKYYDIIIKNNRDNKLEKNLYHGSDKKFEIDFKLLPQNEYTSNNNSSELEKLFEQRKPIDMISRKNSVFLADDIDLIDALGGYTDIIYEVSVDDNIERSDLAWYTESQKHLEEGSLILASKCADKYWSGDIFYDDNQSCFEYRVSSAKIKNIKELNVPMGDLIIPLKDYSKIDFYHGSPVDFVEFDESKIGENFKQSNGFFFTDNTFCHVSTTAAGVKLYEDPYSAGGYAKNSDGGNPVIYICNLDIKNPLLISDLISSFYLSDDDPFDGCHPQDFYDMNNESIKDLCKKLNKDSVVLDQSSYSEEKEITVIVFRKEQIKFKYNNFKKPILRSKNKP